LKPLQLDLCLQDGPYKLSFRLGLAGSARPLSFHDRKS
jgi:hypothetical protein